MTDHRLQLGSVAAWLRLAAIGLVCSCASPQPAQPTAAPEKARVGEALLAQVPIDSPFIGLSVPALDPTTDPAIDRESRQPKVLRSFLAKRMTTLLPLLDSSRPYVIFGLGNFPAARVEYGSQAEVATALSAFLESYDNLEPTLFSGRRYFALPDSDHVLLLAADGLMLSAASVPPDHVTAAVPLVVGAVRPTLAASAADLIASLKERHSIDEAFAVFNIGAYLNTIFGLEQAAGTISRQFVADVGTDRVCAEGVRTFARSFPRVVLGYRSRSDKQATAVALLEHHPSLSEAFSKLRTPMPAIHRTDAPLTIGFATNFRSAFNLARGSLAVLAPCNERWPRISETVGVINRLDELLAPVGGAGLAFFEAPRRLSRKFVGSIVVLTRNPDGLRQLASAALGTQLPGNASSIYPMRFRGPDGRTMFLDLTKSGGGLSVGPSSPEQLSALLKSRSRRESLLSLISTGSVINDIDDDITNGIDVGIGVKALTLTLELEENALVAEAEVTYE